MYIETIYDRFLVARWCYLMADPIISDTEYDKLEKEFKKLYPDDIHSKQGWAFDECPADLLTKYGLTEHICNLTMGYMAESINSINTREEYEAMFYNLNKRSRLSFKIDGWNTKVSYFNGILVKVETRGRSGNNLSANNIAKIFPKKIKYKGRVAITGELSILSNLWPDFKAYTGNSDQRASVRTALARELTEFLGFLAFDIVAENGLEEGADKYEVLNNLGFKTPRFIWVNNFEELEKGLKYMSYIDRGYNYLTDGLVIENDDYQLAIRLGRWEEQSMASYVTGFEEDPGMYGTFLKVQCYPITIEGKTFTKISINNIAKVIENNLRIGYPIAFTLRSAANVVIDVGETRKLQEKWISNLESYHDFIHKQAGRKE